MPLYTGAGDRGATALFDGTTVPKDDPRVAVYGDVDELSATVGLARAAGLPDDLDEMMIAVQRDLFAIGARLADPRSRISARVTKARIGRADVERLEGCIDRVDGALPPLRSFILPGGSRTGAALHQARAVCRRAERRIVGLGVDSVSRSSCSTSTGCPTCCSPLRGRSTTGPASPRSSGDGGRDATARPLARQSSPAAPLAAQPA